MMNRCRILEAARKVFGDAGFRGATTRRIAQEAGVNEVTLFRIFGSKAALISEALNTGGSEGDVPSLPAVPVDPERELIAWCKAQLKHLRDSSALIRKTLSEVDERPELSSCACDAPMRASQELTTYLTRLRKQGRIDPDVPTQAAVAMLMGALFGDAMGRDMMPRAYPQPAESAPRLYTRLFLRAVGIDADTRATAKRPSNQTNARKAAR